MAMEISDFTVFVAASWVLIITPGPDMIYVITRGISQGRRAGVMSAIGVTLGILVHTVFAAFGLAMILRTSALAFLAVKYVGAVYLIYLGIKSIKNKSDIAIAPDKSERPLSRIFTQGILSNVLNPKIALFFLAFLPQFVKPENGSVPLQMTFLGLIFALFGVVFLLIVGYFSGGIGSWLAKRPAIADRIGWFSGVVLIALGVRLAFLKRK